MSDIKSGDTTKAKSDLTQVQKLTSGNTSPAYRLRSATTTSPVRRAR
jgi:hypothetical protein